MTESRPMRQLALRPEPGRPILVLADKGVGKTAMLVHAALDALADGSQVLHVALGDSATSVRAHYDELASALPGVDAEQLGQIERRRMVLSYTERPFDPGHLGAQLHMLHEVAQFKAKMLVIDGFDADTWLEHGEAVCHLSAHLNLPAWISVTSEHAIVRSVGAALCVLKLVPDEGGMRLVASTDGVEEALPWRLDAATNALVDYNAAASTPGLAHLGGSAPLSAGACTLYSGGAGGAEETFGEAAARHGLREVNFTFDGHKQARTEGHRLLTAGELEAGDVSLVYVSRRLKRSYNENGLIRRVLQTLWHIVSRSEQVFVIGAIQEDGTVVGGTGWSVELARMWHKDLWVYDQDKAGWFHWTGTSWEAGNAAITTRDFCGTGTRFLEAGGRQAIEALFDEAFGR